MRTVLRSASKLLIILFTPGLFLSAQPLHTPTADSSAHSDSSAISVQDTPFEPFYSQPPDQMPVWNPMEGPFIPSYKPPRSLILNMPVFGLQDSLRMRSEPHADKYLTPRKRKP